MSRPLPERAAKHFINEVLLPGWDPADAAGYDITAAPTASEFVPVATTIDDVGAVYPSLVVQFSNETAPGESTYDFLTGSGPGQTRTGTLLVTARAQDRPGGYSGGGTTIQADELVVALTNATEEVVQRNAAGGSAEFISLGSQRGADAPDDLEAEPAVRLAQVTVDYSFLRPPP